MQFHLKQLPGVLSNLRLLIRCKQLALCLLNSPFWYLLVAQGRIRGGGGGLGGQDPPPPHPHPNYSYPDSPFPKSCNRPCDTLFLWYWGRGSPKLISLNIIGLNAWSLETYVAGQKVCCLSWFGTVSELFEGPCVGKCHSSALLLTTTALHRRCK